MANRNLYPHEASVNAIAHVYGSFVGNGATSPTVVDGDVASVTRTGAGAYTVTLRHQYQGLHHVDLACVGTTKLVAVVTAAALAANPPTVTIETQAAGVATNAAAADTVYLRIDARNSTVKG